jgi:ferritin-like metal-binding protein YciE
MISARTCAYQLWPTKEAVMQIETMQELYVDVLKDLYDAEQQILKALPKMAKAAHSEELRDGFQEHFAQSQTHVERLDQVFEELGRTAQRKKCKAIEGLLEEGKELMESVSDPEVLDAGLIAAAQKVEHYEIATYGCARTYAELLEQEGASELLQQTLDEEKMTDKKLTELAVNQINLDAAEESEAAEIQTAPRKRTTAQGRKK